MQRTLTLARYIHAQEKKQSKATGELSDLLSAVALGVKFVRQLVADAPFAGSRGYSGNVNVQGEKAHVLDQQADEVLLEILGSSGHFALLVSEERDHVIPAMEGRASAHYVLAFDPLDGSSNLDSNIPVGTIFSIFRKKDPSQPATESDFLQPGKALVAAGYALYGPQTTFVYSCGDGVHRFLLDTSVGEFVLQEDQVRIPEQGSTYSVNEGNDSKWHDATRRYLNALKYPDAGGTPYSARYVGSLVADFDRNLLKGGVYLYPAEREKKSGKLRLLYECMPLAFIVDQAGGLATDGTRNILGITPTKIHDRSPLVIGSRKDVERFLKFA